MSTTANKNVIPKAGQTWEGWLTGDAYKIIIANENIIKTEKIGSSYVTSIDARTFHTGYKFVPQTDLEWFAVNVDKWPLMKPDYVAKENDLPVFYKNHQKVGAYTRDQWQQCSNELFGTEQPSGVKITINDDIEPLQPPLHPNCPCSLTPAIKEKPIYTQAMVDNDETPEEGVLCEGFVLAKSNLLKGKIIADGTKKGKWVTGSVIGKAYADNGGYVMLFKSECGRVYVMSSEYRRFRPVDNRTPEEKAIDAFVKLMNDAYVNGGRLPSSSLSEDDARATAKYMLDNGAKWAGE